MHFHPVVVPVKAKRVNATGMILEEYNVSFLPYGEIGHIYFSKALKQTTSTDHHICAVSVAVAL